MSTPLCAHAVRTLRQSGQGGRPTAGSKVTVADGLTIWLLVSTNKWLQGPSQGGRGKMAAAGDAKAAGGCHGHSMSLMMMPIIMFVGVRLHAILIMASPHSDCDPCAVAYELQMIIKGRTWGHTLHLIQTHTNLHI